MISQNLGIEAFVSCGSAGGGRLSTDDFYFRKVESTYVFLASGQSDRSISATTRKNVVVFQYGDVDYFLAFLLYMADPHPGRI